MSFSNRPRVLSSTIDDFILRSFSLRNDALQKQALLLDLAGHQRLEALRVQQAHSHNDSLLQSTASTHDSIQKQASLLNLLEDRLEALRVQQARSSNDSLPQTTASTHGSRQGLDSFLNRAGHQLEIPGVRQAGSSDDSIPQSTASTYGSRQGLDSFLHRAGHQLEIPGVRQARSSDDSLPQSTASTYGSRQGLDSFLNRAGHQLEIPGVRQAGSGDDSLPQSTASTYGSLQGQDSFFNKMVHQLAATRAQQAPPLIQPQPPHQGSTLSDNYDATNNDPTATQQDDGRFGSTTAASSSSARTRYAPSLKPRKTAVSYLPVPTNSPSPPPNTPAPEPEAVAAHYDTAKQPPSWRLNHTIGTGACGTVFLEKVHMPGMKSPELWAIKRIPRALLNFTFERYQAEINNLQLLARHEWFVKFNATYEDTHYMYIAMEYIPIGDMSQSFTDGYRWNESDTRVVIEQLLHGLAIMHKEGITHRDLKPENIFLYLPENQTHILRVKIGDFGTSKRIPSSNASTYLKTTTGTQGYMAPEVQDTSQPKTNRVDIWSLGCILYRMLAGNLLFDDPVKVWKYSLTASFSHLALENLGFSIPGLSFLRHVLQPIPEDRPSAEDCLKKAWIVNEVPELEYSIGKDLYTRLSRINQQAPNVHSFPDVVANQAVDRSSPSLPPSAVIKQLRRKATHLVLLIVWLTLIVCLSYILFF